MNIKRILYISNSEKTVSHKNIIEDILAPFESETIEIVALLRSMDSEWLYELSKNNLKVNILTGRINIKIIQKIHMENNIDFIVFSNDDGNKSHILPALKKLKRKLNIPILVADQTDDKYMFKHPVAGVNWSSGSDNALDFLMKYKESIKELEIINVINKKLTVKDIRELKEKLAGYRRLFLDEKVDAESHIYAGKTADEILLAAADYKASLVVIGRSGKNSKKIFKNNTAYSVSEKSKIPVLIV